LVSCSEDPDVKGTETIVYGIGKRKQCESCSEDPDVKGTETRMARSIPSSRRCCSEDPDVKGTETSIMAGST